MSDDDHVRVGHRVPKHVRDAAQASTEHGELSEMVRSLYRRVGHGDAEGGADSVAIELERVRAKKDDLRDEIKTLQTELQTLEQQETRLEEKLTKHRSRQDKYEGHLESLEQQLRDGTRVFGELPSVKRAASTVGKSEEEVVYDLKDRNPDVPDHAFESGLHSTETWEGVRDE